MKAEMPDVSLTGLYSPAQTMDLLGVSKSTLRRIRDKGQIIFRIRKGTNRPVTTGKQILSYWKQVY